MRNSIADGMARVEQILAGPFPEAGTMGDREWWVAFETACKYGMPEAKVFVKSELVLACRDCIAPYFAPGRVMEEGDYMACVAEIMEATLGKM